MIYLDPSEYEAHGLEGSTPASWAAAASALMDAHCRRPTLAVAEYSERLRFADGRNTVRLTYLPLATVAPAESPLLAVRARYGVPRRGEGQAEFAHNVALAFALPGSWSTLDPASLEFEAATGELTLPSNPLGFGFNEVDVTYTAGVADVPASLKFACAQIVRNALATPALTVRASSLDRIHFEYFSDTLLDQGVRRLLAPFVAQKLA
jgi:hypothetical protein